MQARWLGDMAGYGLLLCLRRRLMHENSTTNFHLAYLSVALALLLDSFQVIVHLTFNPFTIDQLICLSSKNKTSQAHSM